MAERIDYSLHQTKYFELKADNQGLTVQQYCEDAGLNYDSARRYIKSRPKKTQPVKSKVKPQEQARKQARSPDEWRTLYGMFLANCATNPKLTASQFAKSIGDQPRTITKGFAGVKDLPEFDALHEKVKQARAKKPKRKVNRTPPLHKLAGENPQALALLTDEEKAQKTAGRNSNGQFTAGNRASVTHGLYAKACGLDKNPAMEVAASIDPTSLINELAVARTQYMTMINYLNKAQEIVKERYENGQPSLDMNNNEIPMESEIMKLLFGTSDKLRLLEGSMVQMVSAIAKTTKELTLTQLKEREAKPMSGAEILKMQNRILKRQEDHEWSAVHTVKEMEKAGVPCPEFLMFEAKTEMANYVPPVEDGGISDDELERLSLEYKKEQQAVEGEWLPARRDEIREMFDQMDKHDMGITDDDAPTSEPEENDDLDDDISLMDDAFKDIASFERLDDEIDEDDQQTDE